MADMQTALAVYERTNSSFEAMCRSLMAMQIFFEQVKRSAEKVMQSRIEQAGEVITASAQRVIDVPEQTDAGGDMKESAEQATEAPTSDDHEEADDIKSKKRIKGFEEMASVGKKMINGLKSEFLGLASSLMIFDKVKQAFDFSEIAERLQNEALAAFTPIIEKIEEIVNSESFQLFLEGLIVGFQVVAEVIMFVLELVQMAFDMLAESAAPIIEWLKGSADNIANNWSQIAPIISYVAAVVAVLAAAFLFAAVVQWIYNAALMASPLLWIIMGLMLIVTAVFKFIEAFNEATDSSVSALGIICGAIGVAAAFIGNILIAMVNFGLDAFVLLWNFIAAFANFFGNVFDDPIDAIARLVFDLVDGILKLLESAASAIDTLFGSNLAGAVDGWRGNLFEWFGVTSGKGEEIMEKLDAKELHLDRFNYDKAWDAGYGFGVGIDHKISSWDPLSDKGMGNSGISDSFGQTGNNLSSIAEDTGAIKDSVATCESDLSYLRDIAEKEAINRFTTAEIKIDMTNNNNISSDRDIDGIVGSLEHSLYEMMATAAEGV